MNIRSLIFVLFALFTNLVSARTISVDFSTATLQVKNGENIVLSTPVVLPKGNYYPVPVTGNVTRAIMGPTWIPTANMHRDRPGKYREKYGPYARGNAMGHCKVSIDFDTKHRLLPFVRIHGGARSSDLRKRVSRSCIRIPNKVCQGLINAIKGSGTTKVEFIK